MIWVKTPYLLFLFQVDMQDQLVMCINAIIKTSSQHCENVSQSLFTAIITILALCREQKQHQQVRASSTILHIRFSNIATVIVYL